MRIVLADLRGGPGVLSKDTVAGGYGARMTAFSRVTSVLCAIKRRSHAMASIQLAYAAAILTRAGHSVAWTEDELVDGDVAIVLSSLVDHRRETQWADAMRRRGVPTGFLGLTASKMPELFADHADFTIAGEPESALFRLAGGERLHGQTVSEPLADLDALPFPRWDLAAVRGTRSWTLGRGFPLLASRGCPEFCTYCPHRILAGYRSRSVANIADELAELCARNPNPYIVFRDPLFTEDRERCLALADEILARELRLRFECETRLDRLDPTLIDRLHRAGFRAMSFGVESLSPETLRRAGRRPIPEQHQREVLAHCNRLGILTAAFYVFGFPQDDWDSIGATIDHAIALGSTFAQFKLLTPYPGTPLWKQLGPVVYERDWERFDGFTPTFKHPRLTGDELRFLLGAAYTRFYMRPSFVATWSRIQDVRLRNLVQRMDRSVSAHHGRQEATRMARVVTC